MTANSLDEFKALFPVRKDENEELPIDALKFVYAHYDGSREVGGHGAEGVQGNDPLPAVRRPDTSRGRASSRASRRLAASCSPGPIKLKVMKLRVALLFLLTSPLIAAEPDKPQPKFVLEWGEKGAKPGQFYSPIHIAISPKDEIFVADLNNSRIQQFTSDGKHVGGFDLPLDATPRKSCIVGGLAVDKNGSLIVSFMNQHKIGVYSKDGKLLREWGKKGDADGEFNQPGGIVVRADGKLVIADQCNHRVQVFEADGKFLRKWGGHGTKPGQFGGTEPAGRVSPGRTSSSRIPRADSIRPKGSLGRIQQFDADGKPLAEWGDKNKEPGAFGEYQFGKLKNTFGPIGVFVDRRDRVWVSSLNDRVQCFTPEGKFLFKLEGTDEMHPFRHPHGMAADSRGNLYIADSSNQRIVKFSNP